ncbi:MAG: PAS domain S-box protein, partial [Acidobacteriota bacterium]|nr:PAS domain S-box protein [Acidobacteriota bacterium]
MSAENKHRFINPYLWMLTAIGAVVLLFSACRLPAAILDTRFLVLAILTIVCSRATIQIPRFKSHFSFTDTLIFLTLLLFGGEAAILLAAAEGLCASLRFCKRPISVLSNMAIMAISTFVTVWTLRLCFGDVIAVTHSDYSATLIAMLCVMALVQFVTNSSLAAIYGALKSNQTYWHTWTTSYLWASITYFAGASAAGVIVKLVDSVGFYAFVVTIPAIAIVYFTYRMYLKNVETSIAQAEQSERHAAAMQESEERFRSSFEYAAIGMALVSPEGRWLKVSPSMREIVGYSEQELLVTDFQTITHPADLAAANTMFDELVEGKMPTCHMEKRYHRKGGREVWVLWSASTVRAADSHLLHLIFQIQDITDRKRAEQQLLHEAFHDTLTGLPNRAFFIDRLKLTFERSRRRDDQLFAVLFLDFDRFKIVNDSLGHAVGDQLLEGIA